MGELVCPCIVSFKKGKSHYDSYPFFMAYYQIKAWLQILQSGKSYGYNLMHKNFMLITLRLCSPVRQPARQSARRDLLGRV